MARRARGILGALLVAGVVTSAALLGDAGTAHASAGFDVSGTVYGEQPDGSRAVLPNARITFQDASTPLPHYAWANAEGAFTTELPEGDYTIKASEGEFAGDTPFATTWYGGSTYRSQAETVTIDSDGLIFDFVRPLTGSVSGTVTYPYPEHEGTAEVLFSRLDPFTGTFEEALYGYPSDATGEYVTSQLPPGRYAVRFLESSGRYADEWWDDERSEAEANLVTVESGGVAPGIDAALDFESILVSRIAGQNRFATVSALMEMLYPHYPAHTPVIYVASGVSFPDALSAGPAAIHQGGVILLTPPDSFDPWLHQELLRLDPDRIVVVGGRSAISDSVFADIAQYAPDATARIGGSDRFETSRLVVEDAFCESGAEPCAESALITSGANYPDALSAGPAAGRLDAPVVLVRDSVSGLDTASRAFIDRLGVTHAAVIGGTAVLSEGVRQSVSKTIGEDAERVAGSDRFETSVVVAQRFFPRSKYTFIASGAGFADALAAGPVAGA